MVEVIAEQLINVIKKRLITRFVFTLSFQERKAYAKTSFPEGVISFLLRKQKAILPQHPLDPKIIKKYIEEILEK